MIKTDLGLIICKISVDSDHRTNTISDLSDYVKSCNVPCKLPDLELPVELVSVRNSLKSLRNKYLAHNDREKTGALVTVAEMKTFIEWNRKKLNELCFTEIDERVNELNEEAVKIIQNNTKNGVEMLIK